MTRISLLIAAVAFSFMGVSAQSGATFSTTDSSDSNFPRSGKITMGLDHAGSFGSLSQLVTFSPLIVEGTVLSNLRSFHREPDRAYLVETHSVILLDKILKGEVPKDSRTILLAQTGGRVGDLELVVTGAPVVVPGERYFLFLLPDDRKLPGDSSALPRYLIQGVWSGSIKMLGGNGVQVSPAASESMKSLVGQMTADQLRAKIEATVEGKDVVYDKNLPIHPGGPRVQR